MKQILIGTGNPGKLKTYKELLKDFNFEVVSSKDLNISDPEEKEKTFEAQAVAKAKFYFEKSGIPCIVDDGGFEIDALNGEPGIKSKRWIGREMSDEEIISEVMKRMKDVSNRTCKHTVVLAVASPLGVYTAHGDINGEVAPKPSEKRQAGYPYRSVMYLPNYEKYWVDLDNEEEGILNHRKHALSKLHDILIEISK